MAANPTATELKSLAASRIAEAKALMSGGFYAGAWYLAGYAVELALKAIVCKTLRVYEYPDKVFRGSLKSHDLEELLLLAGLTAELDAKSQNATLDQYWNLVITWDVQDRYQVNRTQGQAEDFLKALEDTENGVFVWLSSRW